MSEIGQRLRRPIFQITSLRHLAVEAYGILALGFALGFVVAMMILR